MARKKRILAELSVGLTLEQAQLLEFVSNNSELYPSLFGRIAIAEKLMRDRWIERAQQYLLAAENAPQE